MTQQPLTPAEIRLAQYGERTSTWSTATYNDGTEKALHEIAVGLKKEVDRLRAELAGQVRYAAALETDLCTCEPLCENGEYLHAADCPVVDVQMQTYGGPPAVETHVVADDSSDPDTGTRLCGYGDYHGGHEWTSRPDVWCPGHPAAASAAARP